MKQIFLVISILCVAGLLPIASSQADQEKTNLEQNKAIVRGYMNEIINKGNLNSFDLYFSERVLFRSHLINGRAKLNLWHDEKN